MDESSELTKAVGHYIQENRNKWLPLQDRLQNYEDLTLQYSKLGRSNGKMKAGEKIVELFELLCQIRKKELDKVANELLLHSEKLSQFDDTVLKKQRESIETHLKNLQLQQRDSTEAHFKNNNTHKFNLAYVKHIGICPQWNQSIVGELQEYNKEELELKKHIEKGEEITSKKIELQNSMRELGDLQGDNKVFVVFESTKTALATATPTSFGDVVSHALNEGALHAEVRDRQRDLDFDMKIGAIQRGWQAQLTGDGILFQSPDMHFHSSYPSHLQSQKKAVERKLSRKNLNNWKVGFDRKNKLFTYTNDKHTQYVHPLLGTSFGYMNPSANDMTSTRSTRSDISDTSYTSYANKFDTDTMDTMDTDTMDTMDTINTLGTTETLDQYGQMGFGGGRSEGMASKLTEFLDKYSSAKYESERDRLNGEKAALEAEWTLWVTECDTFIQYKQRVNIDQLQTMINGKIDLQFGTWQEAYLSMKQELLTHFMVNTTEEADWYNYIEQVYSHLIEFLRNATESRVAELSSKCIKKIQDCAKPTTKRPLMGGSVETTALQNEVRELKNQLDSKTTDLDAKTTDLESSTAELENAQKALHTSQTAKDEAMKEREAAQSALRQREVTFEGERNSWANERNARKQELRDAQTELEEIKTKLNAARAEVATKEAERAAIQTEKAAVESDLASARTEATNANAREDIFQAKVSDLEAQLQAQLLDKAPADARADLESQLNQLRTDLATAKQGLNDANTKEQSLEQDLAHIKAKAATCEVEMSACQTKQSELENDLKETKAGLEKWKQNAFELAEAGKESEEEGRRLFMEMGTKAGLQLEEYEVRIAKLLEQIETLKDKKDKAREGSQQEAALKKEIETLKEKLAKSEQNKSKLTEPSSEGDKPPAVPAKVSTPARGKGAPPPPPPPAKGASFEALNRQKNASKASSQLVKNEPKENKPGGFDPSAVAAKAGKLKKTDPTQSVVFVIKKKKEGLGFHEVQVEINKSFKYNPDSDWEIKSEGKCLEASNGAGIHPNDQIILSNKKGEHDKKEWTLFDKDNQNMSKWTSNSKKAEDVWEKTKAVDLKENDPKKDLKKSDEVLPQGAGEPSVDLSTPKPSDESPGSDASTPNGPDNGETPGVSKKTGGIWGALMSLVSFGETESEHLRHPRQARSHRHVQQTHVRQTHVQQTPKFRRTVL